MEISLTRACSLQTYRKQGRIEEAKRLLEAVIRADKPHYRFAWEGVYKPQALQILKELEKGS
jgi:hypothetical protein